MKIALTALVLVACHRDQPPRVDPLDAIAARIAVNAPGGAVLIEQHGKVILDRAYGFADLENRVPTTTETVFAIGSISKQFAAAAIMQLVEAGKLSLADPLVKFFPDFPRASSITIQQLLQHTTGIVDFEYKGAWPEAMGVERTTAEVIATFRDLTPLFAPGTKWSYSSSNYVLLGAIIEQVSGVPLATYLTAHLFGPAGLAHTRLCDSYELIANRARGYDHSDAGWVPAKWSHLTQFGLAGGLCSTTHDLLRWQHALEDGTVISVASYAQMTTPGTLADGTPIHYGLGLSILRLGGHSRILHSGGVSGFSAFLAHYPADELRIVTMQNSQSRQVEHPLAVAALQLAPPRAVPIAPASLARLAITAEDPPWKVAFVVEADRLVLLIGTQRLRLVHVGDNVFETEDGAGHFRFDLSGGVVTSVRVEFTDSIATLTPVHP